MTLKQIALLKLTSGATVHSILRQFEPDHEQKAPELLPGLEKCTISRVVYRDGEAPAHLPGSLSTIAFDLMVELWFTDKLPPTETDSCAIAANVLYFIVGDNAHLFEPSGITVFGVDEWRTSMTRLMPRPPHHVGPQSAKMLIFLDRRQGMPLDTFIKYYEARHAELALRLLTRDDTPLFSDYARNYPITSESGSAEHRDATTSFGFDVMAEICFWTSEDYERFLERCAQPDVAAELSADESQLFDRSRVRIALAEEALSTEYQAFALS